MSRGGLRGRLLAAFTLVALPPALTLALVALGLLSERLEQDARARLAGRVQAAQASLERERARLQEQLEVLARDDLPAAALEPLVLSEGGAAGLAERLARRRGLALFDLVGADGRLISSAHWSAGLGLRDRDEAFERSSALRRVRVAVDYGMGERLALAAEVRASWRGAPVRLRAGVPLDAERLRELGGLMQAQLGVLEAAPRRWTAAAEAPLARWPAEVPMAGGTGAVTLDGRAWRYAAHPLARAVWLVAVEPQSESRAVAAGLRRATAGVALGALGMALAAAWLLSARLARPVAVLAEGARRVAAGDLQAHVPPVGPRETVALADAFNEMTAALRSSHLRLLQAERVASWREMARRLAHELKNPLFPIQLSLETLRRRLERPASPPEAPGAFESHFREACATILEELASLRRIIDSFSEFARLPAPHLEPTDLGALAAQTWALYGPQTAALDAQLEVQPDLPAVAVDGALLARALGNLVKNALEALPAGGRLRLRVRRHPGGLALEVEDNGPGLNDEQRTRLFTPYYTTKPGGTGLGLSIVQGIVSDHGGRVEVHSQAGHGTRVTIVLPGAPGP